MLLLPTEGRPARHDALRINSMIEIDSANVVLIPSSARMETFQQLWLVKKEVISESATGIFTPVVVQCSDEQVDLVMLHNRVQISGKGPDVERGLRVAAARMNNLITAAGGSLEPYLGLGVNVVAVIPGGPDTRSVEDLFVAQNPFLDQVAASREVSISVSENIGDEKVVMRIEKGIHKESKELGIRVDFNFHRDTPTVEQAIDILAGIDSFTARVVERMGSVEKMYPKESARE
jgi:hypothetical protein